MFENNIIQECKLRLAKKVNIPLETLEALPYQSEKDCHNPFLYHNMDHLVNLLHKIKQKQEQDPNYLIVLDTDYDTDGIKSACVLSGGLAVFGFKHEIYIPSMANGYGLSPIAVDEIIQTHPNVKVILTADNGAFAKEGVSYAAQKGLEVFVTDHHPGNKEQLATAAKVIVSPMEPENTYPWQHNAGGCVAYKVMLAYATKYASDKLPLIQRLIVFAGIANMADMMPMRDENHIIVKKATNDLVAMRKENYIYPQTGLPYYDRLFTRLARLMEAKQERNPKKKLPLNEELISWHLSPILNAPRRVHDTPLEAFIYFFEEDNLSNQALTRLLDLNEEKSKLRDEALAAYYEALPQLTYPETPILSCPHGIVGLIANQLESPYAVAVFSTQHGTIIQFEPQDVLEERISCSARSQNIHLGTLIQALQQEHPEFQIEGGGHEGAAGFSLLTKYFKEFQKAWRDTQNRWLQSTDEHSLFKESAHYSVIFTTDDLNAPQTNDERILANGILVNANNPQSMKDLMEYQTWLESLRPYGQDFNPLLEAVILTSSTQSWEINPSFWQEKGFTLQIGSIRAVCFDTDLRNQTLELLEQGKTFELFGQLVFNNFYGRTSLQIQITNILS